MEAEAMLAVQQAEATVVYSEVEAGGRHRMKWLRRRDCPQALLAQSSPCTLRSDRLSRCSPRL